MRRDQAGDRANRAMPVVLIPPFLLVLYVVFVLFFVGPLSFSFGRSPGSLR